MALRYGCSRRISRLLQHIFSDNHFQQSRHAIINASASCSLPLPRECEKISRKRVTFSFSTISQASPAEFPSQVDVLSFIESTLNELQGPHHCWFNVVEGKEEFFKRDGAFLVLAGQFLNNSSSQTARYDAIAMFEKVKLIQQRFPQLQVIGFLPGCSTSSAVDRTPLVEMSMKEYITFPILLSNKNFPEMANEACYILFKNFGKARVYYEKDLDIGMLKKAVDELNLQQNENFISPTNLKSTWVKQAEVFKEPYACSSARNLLLHFPGCISADEDGNRLFLSDSNHHRIIIFDGNGKILDCIGSCPGFEDGEFESAKLVCPAASFYNEDEDCLYIVDSENHAIRRADMGRRVLETLYPTCSISKKKNNLWTWIVNKLGYGREDDTKSEEFDPRSLIFPWHLMKSEDDDLLIINRSFETLWIMDLASGEIKEVVRGLSNVLEICEQLIMEKVSLLKQIPQEWLLHQTDSRCLNGLPSAGLISSLIAFQNHIIMCDTVGQRIMKLNQESGVCSNFHFSNFGNLGLPYWLASPLESVYTLGDGHQGTSIDHIQHFSLLPGRIDFKLNVDIPSDTELVESLREGCIWLQARGAAAVVSGAEEVAGSSEKVGVAQQWYDELDTLAFSTTESEANIEDDTTASDLMSDDDSVHINCAVNASPGTSEVIIFAALYLKLRRYADQEEESQEKYAARIAEMLKLERNGGTGRDSFMELMLKSKQDLKDFIFIRPLHVRIKLDCLDHPKADNSKDIILTDSNIQVNVSLNT
ncbi:NHL repeat-containing protein 2 [Melia azedarach]|uniref:NHL repeat-containing protein 2 n=1 Tax=Melia azedarach TaxID=155640 RepID=A0ACC1YZP4_MELAZ|nr:NHL repeat-containing protein 2 [Melia azedarach]